jgi:hypothetical protein
MSQNDRRWHEELAMESIDEFSLGLILVRDPQTWSPDEVQIVCRSFMQACDDERTPAGRLLTTRLWRYWFLASGEEPLMADPKYNMALMLNALAFGEFVPPSGDSEFFGRYRQEHAEFEKTLAPATLIWGPRASVNTVSGPTLDSAVAHICIFRANGQICEILIVGQSPPELQQEIFQAVFSCALRVQAGDLDMTNADTYRIFAPDSDQKLFELPGIATLGAASTIASPDDQTAADALSELVQRLRLLQDQTGLVAVHDCDALIKQEFDRSLRDFARGVYRDGNVTIVAKELDKLPEMVGLVTLVPYYQIARRPLPLRIVLHPHILKLPSFEELLQAFTYHTVERICADARVRQESYEERAERLRKEQMRWRNANERMRKELWSESVLLSEIFNGETGTTIRLAQPTQLPTAVYMEVNVPSLIAQYETWAERMRRIINDIFETTVRADTPIRRLVASRFLDAALRGRGHLMGDATIRRYFDRWCAQVAPFLRFQWRTALESKGINPETVFRRHTVFHTRFQVDDQKDVVGLVMQPFAMVSPAHSLLIFDPKQHVLEVRAPSHYAQAFEIETDPDPNELWQVLERAVTEPGANQRDFTTKLRSMLSEAPFELLPGIVEYLMPPGNPDADDQWNEDRLIREQAELAEQIRLVAFPSKVVTLLSQRAFHSARKLIQETQVPPDLKVRPILWQVLVECLARGQSPVEFIPPLAQSDWQSAWLTSAEGTDQVVQLLREARQYDAAFVQEWVDRLESSQDLQPAISLLRRDWMRLEQHLSTPQRQALYKAQSAIESVFLARALETGAQAVASDGENRATVFAKIGQPLADLLLTETGASPSSDVLALLEILVGEESTTY